MKYPTVISSAMVLRDSAKSEKFAALKIFAEGIAHDINNVLTAVLGNISLARLDVKSGSQLYELLTEIEDASLAAKTLMQRLEDFASENKRFDRISSLKGILEDAVKSIAGSKETRISGSIQDDIWPVEIVERHILHVFQSILKNAEQSMPGGGEINIDIANVDVEKGDDVITRPGKYVRISFRDAGCGIGKEQIDRIFDPYFTTRKKAHGMGLAVALSVVVNHNGFLVAETGEGTGSRFSIYLPASLDERDESTADG